MQLGAGSRAAPGTPRAVTSWRPGRRAASLSAKVLVVLAALGLWQLLTATGALNRASFPTMWSTLRALGDQLTTSGFWTTIGQTVEGRALGPALGGTAAVLVGSAIGLSRLASRSTAPVIEFLKAVPSIAILPLAIVVLGTHLQMKLTLVGYAVFFPLVIQVVYGVRALDPTVADTATTLQVRGLRRFLVVVLPSAAPFIATGLRISAATALILEIVAELIGGAPGLGQRILLAENAGPTMFPLMYAFVLVTGILGIVLTGMFTLGERRVLHWHESQRNLRGATR